MKSLKDQMTVDCYGEDHDVVLTNLGRILGIFPDQNWNSDIPGFGSIKVITNSRNPLEEALARVMDTLVQQGFVVKTDDGWKWIGEMDHYLTKEDS